MRSLHRATLSVALTMAPLMGTGCANLASQNKPVRPIVRNETKMNAARLEESRGNLAEARRLYTMIHQQDPSNADCSHRLALVCTLLNQHSEAEVYYRQAYAINAKSPELLADMGYAAFLRKDYAQSESLLEQSVRLNSGNRRTISNLAIVRAWLGKDDSSLATFQCVNDEAESIRNLAAIQIARGDRELGLKNYESAQSVDPKRQSKTTAIASRQPVSKEVSVTSYELPGFSPLPTTPVQSGQDAALHVSATVKDEALSTMVDTLTESTIEVPPAPSLPSLEPTPVVHHSPLVLPPSREPKRVVLSTCVRPVAAMASFPIPVTTRWEPVESPRIVLAFADRRSELTHQDLAVAEPSVGESTQAIVFEIPTKQSSPSENFDRQRHWRKTPCTDESWASLDQLVTSHETRVCDSSISPESTTDCLDLKSICLVTIFEERRIAKSFPEFASEYQSQQYCFSSAEALNKFEAEPQRYAPVAGGLDVVSVRNERNVVQGSLDFAVWFRRRLYLFSSRENSEAFRRDPRIFVTAE